MKENKPLIIDKRDKVKGLYVYCKRCKNLIESRKCSKTGKRLSTCKNADQHAFKAIIVIPDTDGKKRKTKVFHTRDLREATRLKIAFEEELIENKYQSTKKHIDLEEEVEVKPMLLIECMTLYIGYLNNEGVEIHKVKKRSSGHVKDIERNFKNFCLCLKANKIDHTLLKIEELNDKIVGMFHLYLLNEKKYSNKTYNKIIGSFRQFVNWLRNKQQYNIYNPFIDVTRRRVRMHNEIVTKLEFETLLNSIDSKKGFITLPNGKRKNLYRDWLKFAFRLALETGLRREEFMTIRYCDIKKDENGNLLYIEIENYKVNRMAGAESEGKEYKTIPITVGLREILIELDYERNKNSDIYLIAPFSEANRKTLLLFVSKAFTHYWKQTDIEKNIQLKHLRKTYLTALVAQFGDKANLLSSHSGIDVVKKHYVNSMQITAAIRDLKVFK